MKEQTYNDYLLTSSDLPSHLTMTEEEWAVNSQEWGMPTIDEVETEGEAREVAVNWQYFASQSDMSYEELAGCQDYFRELGEKFGLIEEFEENGIV